MDYMELIDALRKEGEEKIHAIWQEAAAKVEKIRGDAAKKIWEMREGYIKMQAAIIKEETDAILSEAEKRARSVMLLSEMELSERLYQIALSVLRNLRGEKYKDVFASLVRELPPCEWEVVRVNPEDTGIAKEYFYGSEILPDNSITSGLEVMTQDGKVRVLNTFEKRLERVWMEIFPEIINDAKCMIQDAMRNKN